MQHVAAAVGAACAAADVSPAQATAAHFALACDAAGIPAGAEHFTALQEQGYGWHPEETYP